MIKRLLNAIGICPCNKFRHLHKNAIDLALGNIELIEAVADLRKDNIKLMDTLRETKNRMALYKSLIEKKKEIREQAKKINNKGFYKGIYCYPGREGRPIPVQNFIIPHDPEIVQDINNNKLTIEGNSANACLMNIYQHLRQRFKYAHDINVVGDKEFWMFPYELRDYGEGDCDDWAINFVSYLRAAGLPAFRVRIMAGNTRGSGVGHATTKVLMDDLKTWKHFNSTTPYNKIKGLTIRDMPDVNDKTDEMGLKKVWFEFNDKNVWL